MIKLSVAATAAAAAAAIAVAVTADIVALAGNAACLRMSRCAITALLLSCLPL